MESTRHGGIMGASHRGILCGAVLCVVLAFPGVCGADGFIIIPDPPRVVSGHFRFAPLEVTYHHVSVAINDVVAVTTVDEEFFNPNGERLEGTYVFPLPEGAFIDRLSMEVGGRMMDAELLPEDKARALYEEIVRKLKDPALLEYAGRGAFRLRIYPLEPRAGKRIRLTYSQLLRNDGGLAEYVYPLNTEKFSSAAVKDVSVKVTLDGKERLKSIYSPSHPVEIRREGDRRAVVGWEARNVWPDTDFKVIFSRNPNQVGIDFLAHRAPGQEGYFMLMASPGVAAEKTGVQPKDICFVLDTSGSMAGAKLDQAKKALRFCLANLGADDRFEIVRFSTDAEPYFGSLVPADKAHLAEAGAFVDSLRPMGGTAIGDALSRALALRSRIDGAAVSRPYLVIFLTDGLPTVGETREDPLVDSLQGAARETRIFSFGIGNDVNTHLLDRIASETRAVSQYVAPEEDIELKVSGFYSKIKEPVLSDISLSFSNPTLRVTQMLPAELPDLFNGDMLVVFGRYSGSGATTAKITGSLNGKPRQFIANVDFPAEDADNPFIPRVWATRRVGWLLDEIRLRGESTELREEVIRLARGFGIVTPYTAYLILEDEAARGIPVRLRSFQEMEGDREAVDKAREKMDSVLKEAGSEASRSGAGAVANSKAVQDMKSSLNEQQAGQAAGLAKSSAPAPAEASGYRASVARNYAHQVQLVNGRAFYQNGNVWTDSTAQSNKALKQKAVRFGSVEYFDLLKKNPGAAPWLALGSNVDVVVDDTLVSIRE
jgi:Ca-activated chloride channel family protein